MSYDMNPAHDDATGVPDVDRDEIERTLQMWSRTVLADGNFIDLQVDWDPRDPESGTVLVYAGEVVSEPEGAPRVVNAFRIESGDTDALMAWLHKIEDLDVSDLEAELDATADEYGDNLAAGWGDWLRGVQRRRQVVHA